jgi:Fe-S-cluster-containing dehydrogenase component
VDEEELVSESDACKRCISRRQFLKFSTATLGAATLLGSQAGGALAAAAGAEDVPAMLIDVSRCVGCGNCQRACNQANGLQPTEEQLAGLSQQTYTYVQRVEVDGGKTRFVKRQCMHCLDAACASACPTSAMHRTEEGPIAWRGERCLGCRYCMVACPFGVPRYEWQNGLAPQVRKCMFCIERQRAGQQPACAMNCPSGALKLGRRTELLKEAHARIAAHPNFYVDQVFGEYEAGGTAMLYISDVPFEKLGFRTAVTKQAVPSYTWQVMEKIPFVAGGLAVVLTGFSAWTRRHGGGHHDEPEWLHEEK